MLVTEGKKNKDVETVLKNEQNIKMSKITKL